MERLCLKLAIAVAGLAMLVPVLLATGMIDGGDGAAGSPADARQADIDDALAAAADSILDRDPRAWDAALPAEGAATRSSWRGVYAGLARYFWRSLYFTAELVPHGGGIYRVQAWGALAGHSEYQAAERLLKFTWSSGHLGLAADRTSKTRRSDYLLAFTDPVVLRRDHLVVVGERDQQRWMRLFAAADEQAHRVVSRLHLHKSRLERRTLVAVCPTVLQANQACGYHEPLGAGAMAFSTNDCIYAPVNRLRGQAQEVPAIVRHELAHALDPVWDNARHYPGVLVEGLAMTAEGGYTYTYKQLRKELAGGNHVLPLKKALALEDIWKGQSDREVDLAYLEGGSLILYLERLRGIQRARKFAWAVAQSDLTPRGVDRASSKTLGLTWHELYTGWKRFVRTLP